MYEKKLPLYKNQINKAKKFDLESKNVVQSADLPSLRKISTMIGKAKIGSSAFKTEDPSILGENGLNDDEADKSSDNSFG